ncbi:response regulator [Ciceribacter azotifigens]|uniref:response regulator n=1 Tax=Ciceribacter azotifigens TaxID=2069303 RepID=UPI003A8820DC
MPRKQALVLIVEDDAFVAMDAADSVSCAGAEAVTAESVTDAIGILEREDVSAAILDFHVRDGTVTPVIERLRERHIPYRVVSGSPVAELAAKGVPLDLCARKPADYLAIVGSLVGIGSGRSLPPLG